ncbi:Gfo/Idh/MocA family oxidoreductase [Cyclobacterium sp.]|uniref:Gfo/Idh/MocA family protein n=1 Tax=Cyclobacterium sp. TaxID=1966343 RepID=UPI00198352B2|nr:Gfo/Idh/MocA family oxidoreductase [Cyclobacterium sp.]MBD3626724.1 Gfo/Idh/MocA family oxidoreductase [Cyclobacterium sp.]
MLDKPNKVENTDSRRSFLKASTLSAAGFFIVPRFVLGGKGHVAPSDKVNVGMIGVGGKGRQNALDLMKLDDVQITAIADPGEYWDLANFYYRSIAGRGPVKRMVEDFYEDRTKNYKLNEYLDFREMLEKEQGLDAICCSTPDNTHAVVTYASMKLGKHVYCEKPLTHNIREARMIKKLTEETGLATQMGNVGHSTDGIRQTVEYLRDGVIGEVNETHSWVPASRWIPEMKALPTSATPKPHGFDWDLWLGPSADRPYHEWYSPVTWRDFWDFGCGALGDFGCHDMDAATWAFELGYPETIEVFPAGFSNQDIAPYGEIGYYHFPNNNTGKPIQLTWYSGGVKPPLHPSLPAGYQWPSRGTLFVGNKGVIVNGGDRVPHVFPKSLAESMKKPDETIPRSNGHFRDWVDAIKGGPAASANFEYGAHLTEITLLGVLSLRMKGQKIHWDAANLKATGLDEADPYISEPVRSGWEMS